MKDNDVRLINEAYKQVVESDQTWLNALANTFASTGARSRINVSKNQLKKYFQKYLVDSGIMQNSHQIEMLSREDEKGEKARQKLFTTVLRELLAIHGERVPPPIPEPEPEPETEPEQETETEAETNSWLRELININDVSSLKQGVVRYPKIKPGSIFSGLDFTDKQGNVDFSIPPFPRKKSK